MIKETKTKDLCMKYSSFNQKGSVMAWNWFGDGLDSWCLTNPSTQCLRS
jgi:hypothetical protein